MVCYLFLKPYPYLEVQSELAQSDVQRVTSHSQSQTLRLGLNDGWGVLASKYLPQNTKTCGIQRMKSRQTFESCGHDIGRVVAPSSSTSNATETKDFSSINIHHQQHQQHSSAKSVKTIRILLFEQHFLQPYHPTIAKHEDGRTSSLRRTIFRPLYDTLSKSNKSTTFLSPFWNNEWLAYPPAEGGPANIRQGLW
jgi:hypothetical protein